MAEFFSRSKREVVSEVASSVRGRSVRLDPIEYHERVEPINGKHRIIGRETPMMQLYDYVAVLALAPMLDAKIGHYQTASVPGRGQRLAQRTLKRWVRGDESRYYVKMDVRKCYPSVDRSVLMALLRRDCGSDDALYLVETIASEYPAGLNIGSYLSMYLANYYLSYAYHFATERLRKTRLNRRTGELSDKRLVSHVLFYMDDIALLGRDKRDLKMAARRLARYLREHLHLEVKPWKVCRTDCEPLDMVGYVFRTTSTTVRSGIFLRARRAFRRARRRPRVPLALAYRCVSYYGFLRHSDCVSFRIRERIDATAERCRRVVSSAARARASAS